jgi:hypothetical protein
VLNNIIFANYVLFLMLFYISPPNLMTNNYCKNNIVIVETQKIEAKNKF